MLLAHLADIHLGFRQYGKREREEDIFSAFETAINNILREHVDVIVIAGDLFHTPVPNDLNVLVRAEKAFGLIKDREIPVIAIPGDHDLPRRVGVLSALAYLSQKGYLYVLSKERIRKTIKGVTFAGLPSYPTSARELLKKKLIELRGADGIILHQAIKEVFPFDWQIEEKDVPPSKYVAMGHIHIPAEIPREDKLIVYPGSLETLSISEVPYINHKYIPIVEITDSEAIIIDKMKIKVRPQTILRVTDDNYKEFLRKDFEKGSIIHVKINSKKPKLIASLLKEYLKKYEPLLIRFTIEHNEERRDYIGSFTTDDALKEVLKDVVKKEVLEDVILLIKALGEGDENEAIEISKKILEKI